MPSFDLECAFGTLVAGFDEAGCGPWAGPVVAACAILDIKKTPPFILESINDSKKLSKKVRQKLFEEFQNAKNNWIDFGVAASSVEEIDAINIRQAVMLAMSRAYKKLSQKPTAALVDGTLKLNLDIPCKSIIKGDAQSFSIAAASILAKETRDQIMNDLHNEFPHYLWNKNAGYGTKDHQEALAKFGITKYHRKSYKPIAAYLQDAA